MESFILVPGNPLDELFRGQTLPPNVSVKIAAGGVVKKVTVESRKLLPTCRPADYPENETRVYNSESYLKRLRHKRWIYLVKLHQKKAFKKD
jgi:hypothetical protein